MPDEPPVPRKSPARSKSNLAFAFISLGKERRRDITIFYAFCRLIDDIADSTELPAEEKARQLESLARRRSSGPVAEEPPLAAEVRGLTARYADHPRDAGGNHRRRGDGSDHRALRDFRRPARILLPRGERGRARQHRDFWLPQSAPAANTRSSSASPSRSLTSCATWRRIWRTAASICRRKTWPASVTARRISRAPSTTIASCG